MEKLRGREGERWWRKYPKAAAAVLFPVLAMAAFGVGMLIQNHTLPNDNGCFQSGVRIEGIEAGGKTKEEICDLLIEKFQEEYCWNVTVMCGGSSYQIRSPLSYDISGVLDRAYALGRTGNAEEQRRERKRLKKEPEEFLIEAVWDEAVICQEVEKISQAIYQEPVNAVLTGYDEVSGRMIFSEAEYGYCADKEALVEAIKEAAENKAYDTVIEVRLKEVEPEYTREDLETDYQLMAEFSTEIKSRNENRDTNVRLASDTISGKIVEAGEEFSMNALVGETTAEKGYKPAPTYAGGKVLEELGGGVCQVSTTLYNAVIKAGLTTTERRCHSLTVSYVNLGEDAMISYGSSDLKFVNNSPNRILIRMSFSGGVLTAAIYGIPVLEEGVTVEMDSYIIEEVPIPEAEYEEDKTLAPGQSVVVTAGKMGYKVQTDLVVRKDGEEVSREFLHNSYYRPKTPLIRRNSG